MIASVAVCLVLLFLYILALRTHEKWLPGARQYIPSSFLPDSSLKGIVRLRRSHSSAFKLIYLVLFFLAAYYLPMDLWNNRGGTWIAFSGKAIGAAGYNWYTGLLGLFVIALGAHLVRMYLSMEELEDPCSDVNERFFKDSGVAFRFVEQLLRLIVVAVLSLKLIGLGWFPGFTTVNATAMFLCVLYGILLFWDLFMLAFSPVRKEVLFHTFPASVFGLMVGGGLFYVTNNEPPLPADARTLVIQTKRVTEAAHECLPESSPILVRADAMLKQVQELSDAIGEASRPDLGTESVIGVCIAMAIATVILVASLLFSLYVHFADYCRCIRGLIWGFGAPHYGERCTIGTRRIRGKDLSTCDAD